MAGRTRSAARVVLVLVAATAAAGVGPGVAQAAAAAPPVAVLRVAAVFADLDSLSPPIRATLEPGRHVAYPQCQRSETNMVLVRFAPANGGLPGPEEIGWTYGDALALSSALKPC